ncbi:MAG: AbrB/MazE/SpoVT family DNA-binding domain-containing protein [Nitrososphaerota archaeon]|nr:AbrB/MazE/SpoVT family DNA-binding domain-containing protein [Nitrososphaerota archaeon]
MDMVKVSSKYQVVIPEKIRREANISPGDRMMVIVKHGVLQYIPVRALKDTRGMVRGLSVRDLREETDRE